MSWKSLDQRLDSDSQARAEWRKRMGEEASKTIYKHSAIRVLQPTRQRGVVPVGGQEFATIQLNQQSPIGFTRSHRETFTTSPVSFQIHFVEDPPVRHELAITAKLGGDLEVVG